MNRADLERRARLLEYRARSRVDSLFAGEYQSAFKGAGMEVEELRPYALGDEVRFVDWNVSARTGQLHVKTFREERDLTVVLAIDSSASLDCGRAGRGKLALARELAALLALACFRKNDRVGLVRFSDRVEEELPPAKGEAAKERLFQALAAEAPGAGGTTLGCLAAHVNARHARRVVVFVFSDFLAPDWERGLALLAAAHDVVPVYLGDGREARPADSGFTLVADPETGRRLVWDAGSRRARAALAGAVAERERALFRAFRARRLDSLRLDASRDYLPELLRFFAARDRRQGLR